MLGATGWLYTQVINFARDLRKSGSDLIIEEDLAVIFGRGRIVEDVLQRFKKDILRSTSISPLYHGCDIVLDQGPGPTVRRAIQNTDQYYMSAVIQLSLLGWMHGRTEEKDLFYLISQMLVGSRFLQEENAAGSSVFLVSDFGWSVYVSAVGDNDPADTKPELLYIQKGVPTNPENGERKSRIRDDVSEGWGNLYIPGIKIFDRGESYVPRCLTQVKRRTEYYGSRED